MNERIRLLWRQAVLNNTKTPMNFQDAADEFAELIVRECVDRVTTKANGWGDMTGFVIKESILDRAKDLKLHFGVEE